MFGNDNNHTEGNMAMLQKGRSGIAVWTGRALSLLVVAALSVDGAMQLLAPEAVAGMMRETGFAMALTPVLGWVMVTCAIVYAASRTAVLGAILVTAFLGGALSAHIRLGELGSPAEIASCLLGLMTWGGLYLRDVRLRLVLPLRARSVDVVPVSDNNAFTTA